MSTLRRVRLAVALLLAVALVVVILDVLGAGPFTVPKGTLEIEALPQCYTEIVSAKSGQVVESGAHTVKYGPTLKLTLPEGTYRVGCEGDSRLTSLATVIAGRSTYVSLITASIPP